MRRLTFHRYLERYVRSLSNEKTNSIYKLVKEVPENLRLREPLFLFAFFYNKVDVLLKASAGYPVYSDYRNLAGKYKRDEFIELLEKDDSKLDVLYRKVYKSYLSRRNMPDTENEKRHLIHKKTRRLQENKGVSNYRLYTDLKLNPSNVNAYLKHGNIARIGKKTAEQMVAYLESV